MGETEKNKKYLVFKIHYEILDQGNFNAEVAPSGLKSCDSLTECEDLLKEDLERVAKDYRFHGIESTNKRSDKIGVISHSLESSLTNKK